MKYPYIGKGLNSGSIVLFYEQSTGVTLDSKTWASKDFEYSSCIYERLFKNITREYLANTHGKVESKGHAEFIVKLANTHNIEICNTWLEGLYFNFFKNLDGSISLSFFPEKISKDYNGKLIIIPLPPKEPESKEWPKAGDNVEFKPNPTKDLWVKARIQFIGDKYTILKLDCGREFLRRKSKLTLRKPKTPEEELRESFISDFKKAVELGESGESLLDKYHMFKKPQ